jgi:hypothetical protein
MASCRAEVPVLDDRSVDQLRPMPAPNGGDVRLTIAEGGSLNVMARRETVRGIAESAWLAAVWAKGVRARILTITACSGLAQGAPVGRAVHCECASGRARHLHGRTQTGLASDRVLQQLASGLQELGYAVEPGKKISGRIRPAARPARSRLGTAACSPVAVEAPQAGPIVAVRSGARRHAVAWAW